MRNAYLFTSALLGAAAMMLLNGCSEASRSASARPAAVGSDPTPVRSFNAADGRWEREPPFGPRSIKDSI